MRMEIHGMDELIEKLEKLSDKSRVDEIAKKAVNAALPTVVSSVQSHIHPRDVAGGVTATAARDNAYGVFAVAKVTGRTKKGSNALRAAVLEYGRHDGRGGHIPWRKSAVSAAESASKQIMEDVIKTEMGCD